MRIRLGDDIDDFCVKCKRVMNHAVVSMVGEEAAKVRCRTCHSDHDYRHEQPPPPKIDPRRVAAAEAKAAAAAAAAKTAEAEAAAEDAEAEEGDAAIEAEIDVTEIEEIVMSLDGDEPAAEEPAAKKTKGRGKSKA